MESFSSQELNIKRWKTSHFFSFSSLQFLNNTTNHWKKKKKVIALYCLAKHDVQQSSLKYRLNNNENNYIFPFFSLSAKLSIQSITPFCLVSEKTKSKTRRQSYNQIVVLGLVQSKSRITKNSKRFKFIFLYKNFPTNQTDHMKPNNIPFISSNIQQWTKLNA